MPCDRSNHDSGSRRWKTAQRTYLVEDLESQKETTAEQNASRDHATGQPRVKIRNSHRQDLRRGTVEHWHYTFFILLAPVHPRVSLIGHSDRNSACICQHRNEDGYLDYQWNENCPVTGHEGWVYGVAWSADGTMLASCSRDKTVRTWSSTLGRCTHTSKNSCPRSPVERSDDLLL